MVLNSLPNASLYWLNFQMICPNNIFAPSPSLFLCAPASHCSLSHPQTPTSSELLSLCHSEDWIIHACCQRWIMWAEQARAHLIAMRPRSYRSHHIDAVSWSHYVALHRLHDNHTRIAFKPWTCKRCTCCVLYWLWPNDKRTDREGRLLPANTPNKKSEQFS